MKKLLLNIIAILCAIPLAYSQPFGDASQGYRIIKLDYTNSKGENATTNFSPDLEGRVVKAIWMMNDDSRYSINQYRYNGYGELVAAYRGFSDDLRTVEHYEYDNKGNKVRESFISSKKDSGSASYFYSDNILQRTEFKKHKGWLNGVATYKYNSDNKKVSAIITRKKKQIASVSYFYDKNNNLVKEYWDFAGKWNQTFIYHYYKD